MAEVSTTAFIDRSHWGRIEVTGADRLRFLHNQSTNNFQQLSPGQGCDTVFVTPTARTLDLASAYVGEESVLVMVSPGMATELINWMDRYIFFADKVTLSDQTDNTFALTLLGPDADGLLTQLGGPLPESAPCSHNQTSLPFAPATTIQIVRGTGLAIPGYTLIGPKAQGPALCQWLVERDITCLTPQQWEALRIRQGRPMPGQELTDKDNPLEAGLWQAVSFDKGCYIGQETITRLNTYQGVKKQLWGFKLEQLVPAQVPLSLDGTKVGTLTSVTTDDDGIWGLGYLRTKAGGAGLTVTVENTTAHVVELPFISRGYLDG
ncbi:CAF17-like 4Fe-4S cluster assembly/insertion protein YgfZ [Leptothoe sp. PORK10 BA2]|uniref:CAF17-like 4Fe-4S cluster assembly/insertion protein YgfZ n=1 Tax=Leptothoe sp. PORK10 BA2 TaxID=3110254 RepID=UPI002B2157A4|nr:folate-binding protein [Leptothoe sp. PORK10 BA2]MEA5466759.1 folate-binding protein [Leptothoe sp. PORK10 BA2]